MISLEHIYIFHTCDTLRWIQNYPTNISPIKKYNINNFLNDVDFFTEIKTETTVRINLIFLFCSFILLNFYENLQSHF